MISQGKPIEVENIIGPDQIDLPPNEGAEDSPPVIEVTPGNPPTEGTNPETETLTPEQEAEKASQEFWKEVFRTTHETAETAEKEATNVQETFGKTGLVALWEKLNQENPSLDKPTKVKIASIFINLSILAGSQIFDLIDAPLDLIDSPEPITKIVLAGLKAVVEAWSDRKSIEFSSNIVKKLTGGEASEYVTPISKLIGGFPLGFLPIIGEIISPTSVEAGFRLLKEFELPGILDKPRKIYSNIYDNFNKEAVDLSNNENFFFAGVGIRAVLGEIFHKKEIRKLIWEGLKTLFK